MTIMGYVFLLLLTMLAGGVKTAVAGAAGNLQKQNTLDIKGVLQSKLFYAGAAVWMLVCAVIWLWGSSLGNTPADVIRLLQIADLLMTYLLLTYVDIRQKIVPNEILTIYLAWQLLLGLVSMGWKDMTITAVGGGILLLLLLLAVRLSKEGAGYGDAKLLGVTAMTAGWMFTVSFAAIGLGLSFICGLVLMLTKKANGKSELPFVPFLTGGMVIYLIGMIIG